MGGFSWQLYKLATVWFLTLLRRITKVILPDEQISLEILSKSPIGKFTFMPIRLKVDGGLWYLLINRLLSKHKGIAITL